LQEDKEKRFKREDFFPKDSDKAIKDRPILGDDEVQKPKINSGEIEEKKVLRDIKRVYNNE